MPSDEKTYVDTADGVPAGTQLNGIYEIDERIAMGGMGEVYRGHNIQTGDVVAIKIVLPEFAKDETILALFRKEASVLNHLSHDSIVRYHVFTIDPGVGRPYLAMEFVDGQSLADRINEGPMPLNEARKMIAGVASGLQAAHDAGIIHRDLSPDNIILVESKGKKKAKIIDFGIAKSSGVGGGTLLGGKFAGKYNFVSPEQLGLFDGEVTERSDIYSLGLVAAASLLGKTVDMSGSQVDVIEKRRVIPDVSGIDSSVRPIVEAMLKPDPADRPVNMAAVVEWLFPTETSQAPESVTEPPENLHQETIIAPAPIPTATGTPPVPSDPPASMPPASVAPVSIPPATSMPQQGINPYDTGIDGPDPSFVPHYSPSRPPAPVQAAATAPPGKSRGGLIAGLLVAVLIIGGGGAYFSGALDGFLKKEDPKTGEEGAPTLSPTKDGKKPEVATNETKVEEKPEGKPLDRAAAMVDWLNNYNGGPCFHVAPTMISQNSIQIESFTTTVNPLQRLEREFRAEHGIEPDIQARLIDQNQCAVAEFLRAIHANSMSKPTLKLSSSNVKSGQSLSGELGKITDGSVNLVLVDNEGVVYNLAGFLKKKGDIAKFSIKLVDLETRDPLPQLILALSSSEEIRSIKKAQPELASELFSRILKAVKDGELQVGAVAKYFKLGG